MRSAAILPTPALSAGSWAPPPSMANSMATSGTVASCTNQASIPPGEIRCWILAAACEGAGITAITPRHTPITSLVPTFRSSCSTSAPTFHELRKAMGTSSCDFRIGVAASIRMAKAIAKDYRLLPRGRAAKRNASSARIEERGEPRLDAFGDLLTGAILGVAEGAGAGISLVTAGDVVGDARGSRSGHYRFAGGN